MTLKDDLIAAKALIDTPERWNQRWPVSGTLCAVDALAVINGPSSRTGGAMHSALVAALPPGQFKRMAFVGGYNDDPTTTHADIMSLFDRAIESAS